MYVRVVRPADLNASGSVTPLDLSVLANNYGTTVDPVTGQLLAQNPTLAAAPTGDTNGDGVVDASDLSAVIAGIGPPSDPNFVPIDEDLTEAEASVVAAAFDQLTGFTLTSTNCAICASGVRKVQPVNPFDPANPEEPPIPPGGGGNNCDDPGYTGDRGHCDDDDDGKPNSEDDDDDGDGIEDASDPDHDTDGDGIPNGSDPDDDGDGIPDSEDGDHPSNGYAFGAGGASGDPDADEDGIPDYADCDRSDYSGDVLNDCGCQDEDGDGIWNQNECDSPCPDQRACCEHAWIDIRTDTNNDHAINVADEDSEWESPDLTQIPLTDFQPTLPASNASGLR